MMGKKYLALGFMSGTSADGVDCAVIETDGESEIQFVGAETQDYESSFQETLIRIASDDCPLDEVLSIERELSERHVAAGKSLLQSLGISFPRVDVVGLHGHTIRHQPKKGVTWQIGNPAIVAEELQTMVVSSFRNQDMAAGGQGAPLAPLFHQHLVHESPKPLAIVNIGGVSNVTWIGSNGDLVAGDSGPGCCLLDAWMQLRFECPFDQDGHNASLGKVSQPALDLLRRHPFYGLPFPKSADRFDFDFAPVQQLSAQDGAATLSALTASTISTCIGQFPELPRNLYVCGGGARNSFLLNLLGQELNSMNELVRVHPIETLGFRGDSLEAECFAWLAVRRLRGLPTSLPSTTGCGRPISGGTITKF